MRLIALASALLLAAPLAWAAAGDPIGYFRVSGDMLATSTVADRIEGAQYSRGYVNPAVLSLSGGARIWGPLYLGARFENWFAGRNFTLGTTEQKDTLSYRTLGLEAGYVSSSPRVIYLATASVFYPLSLRVSSKTIAGTDEYAPPSLPLAYALRMALGIRFSQSFSLVVEAGYRFANLGKLSSGSFPYLGSEPLDLSGAFAGLGLGLSF